MKYVLLKIDADLHAKIKSRASLKKTTLTKLCVTALEEFMAEPEVVV